jgi:tripartite-type tricarboxylate transporter receptor subunit TctC
VIQKKRFNLAASVAVALMTLQPALPCVAQNYPLKPIRISVGVAPGGSTDLVARLIAQKLSDQFGQAVVVENRVGAGGAISAERTATAAPDGYSLMAASAGDAVIPALRKDLPYDFQRDLAPIARMAISPYLLVTHPSLRVRTVKDLIGLAKANPGKLNFGSTGAGGALLAGALFNQMAQVQITPVPFRGGSEAMVATLNGQIEVNYPTMPVVIPFLNSGKVTVLATTTAKRVSFVPNVPTISESGLAGYEKAAWVGLLAPGRVPKDIIAKLNGAIRVALNSADLKESFAKQSLEPLLTTPEEFSAFLHNEIEQNIRLIKLTGIKTEQ